MSKARDLFRHHYNGHKNLLTPTVLSCKMVGDYAVELSQGRGITDQLLYGVTVIHKEHGPCHTLGACFFRREAAESYIKTLKWRDYQ